MSLAKLKAELENLRSTVSIQKMDADARLNSAMCLAYYVRNQNKEQAEVIKGLREEIAALRAQISRPSLGDYLKRLADQNFTWRRVTGAYLVAHEQEARRRLNTQTS